MTVRTPMAGITAPRHPARAAAGDPHAEILDGFDDHPRRVEDDEPVEDFAAQAGREGPRFAPSRNSNGWTPERQRAFLAYVADGLTIGDAATLVGLSAASAYAFRTRAAGAAFAIGWQGALLLQRNRLVDELTSRAFRGQTETITRPDGSQIDRHRYDNRLALALLTRLDKIAAADLPDRTGDARAARLAAQDWDRYLDLIGSDASPAQAGMFLALRVTEGEASAVEPIVALARADLYRRAHVGHASEVDVSDLDPARRQGWTADQWARAEAAGLVALAPAPAAEPDADADPAVTRGNSQPSQHWDGDDTAAGADDPVWWSLRAEAWRTRFPPPADFYGVEDGAYGDPGYERELTDAERDAWDAPLRRDRDHRRPIEEAERDTFFAALMAEEEAPPFVPSAVEGPAPHPFVPSAVEGPPNSQPFVLSEVEARASSPAPTPNQPAKPPRTRPRPAPVRSPRCAP